MWLGWVVSSLGLSWQASHPSTISASAPTQTFNPIQYTSSTIKYTIEYNFIEHLNVKQDFLNTQIHVSAGKLIYREEKNVQ